VPELDGPFRRADYAHVEWTGRKVPNDAMVASLSCFRSMVAVSTWRYLLSARSAPLTDISGAIGYGASSVRQHLKYLVEHRWVRTNGGRMYTVNSSMRVPQFCLTTYEIKLRDWHQAYDQLVNHLAFADRVVLVMPVPARRSTETRILEGVGYLPASVLFVGEQGPTVGLWQSSARTPGDARLCALGKVCAQHLATTL
jgi:hypothetical protein